MPLKKIIYPIITIIFLLVTMFNALAAEILEINPDTLQKQEENYNIAENLTMTPDMPQGVDDNYNPNQIMAITPDMQPVTDKSYDANEYLPMHSGSQQTEDNSINSAQQYDMKQALDDVYGGIYENSETEEALIDYLDKLRPDDSGLDIGIGNYILNLQANNIYSRLLNIHNNRTISYEIPDFFSEHNFSVWNMVTLGNSKQSSINKKLAYNTKSRNIILGLDKNFATINIGFAVSFDKSSGSNSTMIGSPRDQDLSQNSYLASVYADSYCFSNFFWRAIVTTGHSNKSITRFHSKAEMNSSYKGKQLGVNLSVGYETSFFIFNLEPELIFRFTNVRVDEFHNIPVYSDIPAQLGEIRGKMNNYRTDLGIGINLMQSWVYSECVISPKIRVALYKNINNNDNDKIWLSFMQGRYDTEMAYSRSNIVDYSLSIDFGFKQINISIYYNGDLSKNNKANSLVAKLNVAF